MNMNADNAQIEMKFKFTVDMSEYAKRFGISIPDDSSDVITEDDGSGDSVAQDDNDEVSEVCRSPHPETCRNHGSLRRAKEAVEVATNGVTVETLSKRIDEVIDNRLIDIRLAEGERDILKGSAIDFFVRYAKRLLPLSTNGYLCFVPGDATVERNNGDRINAWAEYAIHAVTNDNVEPETGKHYRVFAQKKVDFVNPVIPEIVQEDKVVVDDRRGKVIFIKDLSNGVARIVAKPMEKGNLWADLGDVTNIYTSKIGLPDIPVPLRKAAEARGVEGKLPLTPGITSDDNIIAQDEFPSQWWIDAVAEDATVSFAPKFDATRLGKQIKATFAQCQAKNPLTCRYHGSQVLANDIEAALKAAGVNAPVNVELLDVDSQGGKQLLSVMATITATPNDRTAITNAMKAFFQVPGIQGGFQTDNGKGTEYDALFDMDMLNPNAKKKWDMFAKPTQQTKPAPKPTPKPTTPAPQPPQQPTTPPPAPAPAPVPPVSAPTAPAPVQVQHGGKLHPDVRPKKPPTFSGLIEEDFDFLDTVSQDLCWLEQRVNHNIAKGNPGAGTQALTGFKSIDKKKLDELSKKDTTGQASLLKDLYDQAEASEKNGWSTKIEPKMFPYDDSKYNGSDPKNSTAFDQWKFDRGICPKDPHAKQRAAYLNWKNPADTRNAYIKACSGVASSKDPDAPSKEVKELESVNTDLCDIEENISALDEAIKNEKDPDAKRGLQEVLDDVEGSYFDADKKYSDLKSKIDKWVGKQQVMQGSIKDTMDAITARGGKIPPYMKNWQDSVDAHRVEANQEVAKETGIKDDFDKIAKENCQSLYERACKGEISIGSQGYTKYFLNMLDGAHPFGEPLTGRYSRIATNCFGAKPHDDMSAFCRAIEGDPAKFPSWWSGDCVCFVNPKKAVLGINAHLYDGADHYGENLRGTNLVMMTDANASVANCDNMGGGIVTKDCTKSSTHDFMRDTGLASGNETHVLGGITLENCLACKFFGPVPKFTANQIATIRQYGIKIYDRNGNIVTV